MPPPAKPGAAAPPRTSRIGGMRITTIGGGPGGLFASILLKKALPALEVQVLERNGPDDTFGWGVVFSDETLDGIRAADPESFEAIASRFAHWTGIDIHVRDRVLRSGGHGFAGVSRKVLLNLLQARAESLGVRCRYRTEVTDLEQARRDADLVIAADGVNSGVRTRYAEHFRPDLQVGSAKYIWLGTRKQLPAFTFVVKENEHGTWCVHAYQFESDTSTWIVETDPETFRAAGLADAPDGGVAYLQDLFASELGGEALLTNKATWREFLRVRCERWRHGNVVLLGDAAHTAHFSIGSGTKLAMEDAVALARAIVKERDPGEALAAYEAARQLDVAKLQRVAERSQAWFEDIRRHVRELPPEQLAFSMMTRSYKVTHANLAKRDPAYVASVDRWFAGAAGIATDTPPPPMFTPFTLRGMKLPNRVVVSPMCQYSCEDGHPSDWHVVHLGSRAVGGAALVIAEMTDVERDGRISPGCAGMYLDSHVAPWRRVTDFIHAWTGARAGIQLAHAGRKGSTRVPWEGAGADAPLADDAWPLVAPSPIPWGEGFGVPEEMTRADLDRVLAAFVEATRRADAAGFDFLELHAAHGYLLAEFLSPLTNHRKDEYGGTLANRMRFPLEVFAAVRAAWPEDKPAGVRLSATDWLPGGFTPAEAVAFCRELKSRGCDLVDVSSGGATPEAHPDIYGRMYQVPFADLIRNEAQIATMAVGNITEWDQVNTILAAGRADLVCMARQHLRDPYFTLHAAAEQGHALKWPNQYLAVMPRD